MEELIKYHFILFSSFFPPALHMYTPQKPGLANTKNIYIQQSAWINYSNNSTVFSLTIFHKSTNQKKNSYSFSLCSRNWRQYKKSYIYFFIFPTLSLKEDGRHSNLMLSKLVNKSVVLGPQYPIARQSTTARSKCRHFHFTLSSSLILPWVCRECQ